jgi:hypothetical protein
VITDIMLQRFSEPPIVSKNNTSQPVLETLPQKVELAPKVSFESCGHDTVALSVVQRRLIQNISLG